MVCLLERARIDVQLRPVVIGSVVDVGPGERVRFVVGDVVAVVRNRQVTDVADDLAGVQLKRYSQFVGSPIYLEVSLECLDVIQPSVDVSAGTVDVARGHPRRIVDEP